MIKTVFLALLAGSVMSLGFAPYTQGVAPLVSCILLLSILRQQSPKCAFSIGWLYGIGMFGTGIYWIYISIHDFGNAAPWLAGLITALLIIGMGLYPAVLASLLCRFCPKENATRHIVVFPILWVLLEMLRGWLFTGFPWLYVGNTQINTPLKAFAPLGGVWLVSWITLLLSGLLYHFYANANKIHRKRMALSLLVLGGITWCVSQHAWTTPTPHTLSVALIQGNIAQLMRWDPQHVNNIIHTYESLTLNTLDQDLIIWPEAAIPLPLPIASPLFERLGTFLKTRHIGLIAGVPMEVPDGLHFYTSLIGVGDAEGLYHKRHLVPFGEYVPLEQWLRGLIGFFDLPMSSIISGPAHQTPLTAHGYRFAPAVCYEIAYPHYVQKMSKQADFILTVSNDAWFGQSVGPAQHLQIAQYRALETGKYVLRATNTGFTTLIGPNGNIQAMSPPFIQTILTGNVTVMAGETPWVRWGAWPMLMLFALLLVGNFCYHRPIWK